MVVTEAVVVIVNEKGNKMESKKKDIRIDKIC